MSKLPPDTTKERLNSVDAMKFLMAFAVVAIHIHTLFNYTYPECINWFISLAVPFFFIASGFLTGRRLSNLSGGSEQSTYLRKKALRFGRMFGLWILIYMPLSLITFKYDNTTILVKDIARYLFSVVCTGASHLAWPLWYLYSSMIVYFILSKLSHYKNRNVIIILLTIAVLIVKVALPYITMPGIVLFLLTELIERVVGGLPYIVTGLMLYKYSHQLSNRGIIFITLALSIILFHFDVNIFPLFGGLAFFMISYILPLQGKTIYTTLNIIGIWIYLTHMFNLVILQWTLNHTDISIGKYPTLITAFVFTFITSYILYRISRLKGFNWLNRLT